MKLWSDAHQKLLETLQAQQLIPPLYARLSLERYAAHEDDLRRLVAWPRVLQRQPGWKLIEPALNHSDAWPETWELASQMGFEPLAHHHHALLFTHLTERLIKDREFDHASWTWTQCLKSWKSLANSNYLTELIEDITPQRAANDDRETTSHAHGEILTSLLTPMFDAHEQGLYQAIALDPTTNTITSKFDQRLAQFHIRAFESFLTLHDVGFTHPCYPNAHELWEALYDKTIAIKHTIRETLLQAFEQATSQVNISDDEAYILLAPFEWIASCCNIMRIDDEIATLVVTQAVEFGWKMRKLGREDDSDEFDRMLMVCAPFQQHLVQAIESGRLVGPNSKCSDFMVFQGEHADEHDTRKELFERALQICPGHRNASLMLSYEHLYLANQTMAALSRIPAPLKHLNAGERTKKLWNEAHKHIETAREIYPFNTKLESYEERLKAAAERLRVHPNNEDTPS